MTRALAGLLVLAIMFGSVVLAVTIGSQWVFGIAWGSGWLACRIWVSAEQARKAA